jgi:hypothetical protein
MILPVTQVHVVVFVKDPINVADHLPPMLKPFEELRSVAKDPLITADTAQSRRTRLLLFGSTLIEEGTVP